VVHDGDGDDELGLAREFQTTVAQEASWKGLNHMTLTLYLIGIRVARLRLWQVPHLNWPVCRECATHSGIAKQIFYSKVPSRRSSSGPSWHLPRH